MTDFKEQLIRKLDQQYVRNAMPKGSDLVVREWPSGGYMHDEHVAEHNALARAYLAMSQQLAVYRFAIEQLCEMADPIIAAKVDGPLRGSILELNSAVISARYRLTREGQP